MSHEHEEIVCPNCGYHAVENYCARCGQETHLHKETFWGLVIHFAGHYFHYDSKFWQTMKALWFSPGRLTIAYWNKQRMRYIAPISLYIFISFVYFLISLSMPYKDIVMKDQNTKRSINFTVGNSSKTVHFGADSLRAASKDTVDFGSLQKWADSRSASLKRRHENPEEFMRESIMHTFPKLFFFLIPLMAAFLKLLYARRKDLYFVDHAIFALHFHSFWFSLFALEFPFTLLAQKFNGVEAASTIVSLALIITALIYMVRALHNVYGTKTGRALLYTLVIGMVYSMCLVVLLILSLLYFFCMG